MWEKLAAWLPIQGPERYPGHANGDHGHQAPRDAWQCVHKGAAKALSIPSHIPEHRHCTQQHGHLTLALTLTQPSPALELSPLRSGREKEGSMWDLSTDSRCPVIPFAFVPHILVEANTSAPRRKATWHSHQMKLWLIPLPPLPFFFLLTVCFDLTDILSLLSIPDFLHLGTDFEQALSVEAVQRRQGGAAATPQPAIQADGAGTRYE